MMWGCWCTAMRMGVRGAGTWVSFLLVWGEKGGMACSGAAWVGVGLYMHVRLAWALQRLSDYAVCTYGSMAGLYICCGFCLRSMGYMAVLLRLVVGGRDVLFVVLSHPFTGGGLVASTWGWRALGLAPVGSRCTDLSGGRSIVGRGG
ncbi:hypothetical protein FA95DRAFT_1140826 [Auriscalpium vulgare]|uniref:Uncharacterized protein n=1 Tax=Auriscalpium vulgare TaxID=40419 RepID=A0ACB8RW03_9AGAM|nr:hypothetical protein FA95DRAFT_1140826 [Auriscalpium vulgare]